MAGNFLLNNLTFSSGTATLYGNLLQFAGTTPTINNNSGNATTVNNNIQLDVNTTANTGSGDLTLGGTISGTGNLQKGNNNNTLTLSGTYAATGDLWVPQGAINFTGVQTGAGAVDAQNNAVFTNSGSLALTNKQLKVGGWGFNGSVAVFYNNAGGTINQFGNSSFTIGKGGAGTFNNNGGTTTVGNSSLLSIGLEGNAAVTSGNCTLNVNSGTFTVTATCPTINLGGTGGSAANSTGILNLNGGTFATATRISKWQGTGTGNSATVNLNGGTLSGTANNVTLLGTDLTAVNVKSNGAVIAVGSGLTNTIAANLLDGSGGGGLTVQGPGTLVLSGINTYSGGTTISAGTLLVNGSIGSGAVSNASGATLGGSGTIGGAVVNNGTVQPGLGGLDTSTLTINNTLNLAGTTVFALNRTNAQTASKLAGITTLTLGGTLTVNNVGSTLQANDTFSLYTASSASGNFSATNLPTLGTGTNWWTTNNYATLLVNKAPTAGNATYTRVLTNSLRITITDLLTNVTGTSAGQTISLASVGSGSQSATITTDSTFIYYTPVNTNSDSFTYTISDARGGSATGNIAVNVIKVTGQDTGSITVSNNIATTRFEGIPGWTYVVQRNTNLVSGFGWKAISTNVAPPSGVITNSDNFSDLNVPPYPSSAYYRVGTN